MEDALGRNILPKYADWEHEDIVADLDSRRHNFSVMVVNIELEINSCGIIRGFDTFLGREFYFYGRRQWNRRAGCGSQHYHPLNFIKDVSELDWSKFCVVGLDNVEGAKPLETHQWDFDKHTLICFGQEKGGIPPEIIEKCDDVLIMEQYGAIKCANVNACAHVVMYDYVSKFNRKNL